MYSRAKESHGRGAGPLAPRVGLLVFSCLSLLAACDSPSSGPPAPQQGAAAFVYTYVAQPDGGVAGGRASDGATVWRASIGHAGYPPVIVGSMLFADAQKQGEATEAVVAVRATDGHVL